VTEISSGKDWFSLPILGRRGRASATFALDRRRTIRTEALGAGYYAVRRVTRYIIAGPEQQGTDQQG